MTIQKKQKLGPLARDSNKTWPIILSRLLSTNTTTIDSGRLPTRE
nr:MAG TPA: hypothetical protein [Caudoviricetes sp.]